MVCLNSFELYRETIFSLGAPEKTVPLPTGDRSTNVSLKHINHFGTAK